MSQNRKSNQYYLGIEENTHYFGGIHYYASEI